MEALLSGGPSQAAELSVRNADNGDHVLCRPVGELDSAGSARLLAALAGTSFARLVIDLSDVSFVDSAGLGALLGTIRRAREVGGDVALCHPQRQPERLLRAAGFPHFVALATTVAEAVAALNHP
jgi:anti-sigma B factor antagonist